MFINQYTIVKSNVQDNLFHSIDSEDKAYWLGFLYADGCLSDNTRISIMLKIEDANHLEKFKNFLCWNGQVKIKPQFHRCELTFRSKEMFTDLVSKGCFPNKSLKLCFPTNDIVPNNFLRDFIRGYVDGDGSLGVLRRGQRLYPRMSIAGNYNFLNELLVQTKWKRNKILQRKNGLCIIEWQGKYGKKFAHELYDNASTYLDRKFEIVNTMPF